MSAVDHQTLGRVGFGRKGSKDALEDAHSAPSHETVVQRLVRAVATGRVFPLQAVADHVDDPADHAAVVHARDAVRLRKERLDALHLGKRQKEQVGHGYLRPP